MENDKIEFTGAQHEGCVMSWDLAKNINAYIRSYNIFNLVEHEICFEEIILTSLEKYFQGSVGYRYCKVFWENDGYNVKIDDILKIINNNEKQCAVKRVPRDLNSMIRKYINNDIDKIQRN